MFSFYFLFDCPFAFASRRRHLLLNLNSHPAHSALISLFLSPFFFPHTNSAILRDSHVLLLDEISAALDSVSEAALHSALERVLKVRQYMESCKCVPFYFVYASLFISVDLIIIP